MTIPDARLPSPGGTLPRDRGQRELPGRVMPLGSVTPLGSVIDGIVTFDNVQLASALPHVAVALRYHLPALTVTASALATLSALPRSE